MGNEYYKEEKEYKEKEPEDYSNEYIRYGIISKKMGERALEDSYISIPNLNSKENKEYSLFGVFDGHNNSYIANFLSENMEKYFKKEIDSMNNTNYETKIKDIFKLMDKDIKEKQEKEQNEIINEIDNKEKDKEKGNKAHLDVDIDQKEIQFYKDILQNSSDIPEDLKKVEDSEIKDLLLFRNLFKYNNNYLYNNNDVNYIGCSASIIIINDKNIIAADLGITTIVLFNKKGEIKNKNKKEYKNINDIKDIKEDHTFENKEEKKRVKKFNKEIEYDKLKDNIYLPASRCFGLYKYKKDEILKEENQIISCVPDVIIYDKNDIDFILLMTKGMMNTIKDNLKQLIEKIINSSNNNSDIKISQVMEDYIKQREIELDKNNSDVKGDKDKNNLSDQNNNIIFNKGNNSIYIGKEDFCEENTIIDELNKNYYKDIMNMNKNNDPNYNCKKNTTCILIEIKKKEEDKNKLLDNNIEKKDEDTNKNNEIKEENIEEKMENKN